jgi:hypothetical protein
VRSYEYYLGDRGWSAGAADAAIVFHSGPDRSGVVFHGRRGEYLHVYAEGFGTRLVVQRAALPEGPWSAPALLIPCAVPAGDASAFCREPAVHPELMDPLRPDELAITYDLDTPDTARRAERPLDYWPRLVRVAIP